MAGFFEYVERIYPRRLPGPGEDPPPATGKRFAAVGAADAALDRFRRGSAELPWDDLPSGSLNRTISKERRQGGYDNIHLHGTMGTVGDIDATDPDATPRLLVLLQ